MILHLRGGVSIARTSKIFLVEGGVVCLREGRSSAILLAHWVHKTSKVEREVITKGCFNGNLIFYISLLVLNFFLLKNNTF